VKRRPYSHGPSLPQGDQLEVDDGGIADPDPTVGFPQWSRSLLLLLDYAIIEGIQRRQLGFVHYLKLAEAELTKAASDGTAKGGTEPDDERPARSKAH